MSITSLFSQAIPDIPESVLTNIIIPLFIFLVTILVSQIVRSIIKRSYEGVVRRHNGKITFDQTHYAIISRLVVFLIYFIGLFIIVYEIPALRTIFYSALAGAGVLAILLGFATKDVFANVMSGVSVAIFEPFRVGDKISVKGETGTVEDITLRHTVIRTWENKRVVIPNAIMSTEAIVNNSILDPKVQKLIEVNISYESDIERAKKIMLEQAKKHPGSLQWTRELPSGEKEEKMPLVYVVSLGESGVLLRLYFWAEEFGVAFMVGCELLERIKERFAKEGITIPYPHRVILYKKEQKAKRR